MVTRPILGGIAGCLIAVSLASVTYAAGPPAPSAADIPAGQAVFQQYCAACHGLEAKGGLKLGDATAADLRWQTLGPAYHDDPALVQRAILQGQDQDGKALDDVMPRWQGKLTTTQVQDLVAYLQTLTTAVPGQVVATPVHEEATPVPTEEAQEAVQAATVVAQAKATTSGASTAAVVATPAETGTAAVAATPAALPATGGGGGQTSAMLLLVIGLIGLAASALYGVVRRRARWQARRGLVKKQWDGPGSWWRMYRIGARQR